MRELSEATGLNLQEIADNNPIIGMNEEELRDLNDRYNYLQHGLRAALATSASMGIPPEVAYIPALTATTEACAKSGDRLATAYLIALGFVIREVPEGPIILLKGELRIGGVVKAGDEIPDHLKDKVGSGPAKAGVQVIHNGNVIDATSVFGGPRQDSDTIH